MKLIFTAEAKTFQVLYYIVITKYSEFIITMSKLIYPLTYSWIARVICLFLMPSGSYMEYREYLINHTWYNVNHFVNESIKSYSQCSYPLMSKWRFQFKLPTHPWKRWVWPNIFFCCKTSYIGTIENSANVIQW